MITSIYFKWLFILYLLISIDLYLIYIYIFYVFFPRFKIKPIKRSLRPLKTSLKASRIRSWHLPIKANLILNSLNLQQIQTNHLLTNQTHQIIFSFQSYGYSFFIDSQAWYKVSSEIQSKYLMYMGILVKLTTYFWVGMSIEGHNLSKHYVCCCFINWYIRLRSIFWGVAMRPNKWQKYSDSNKNVNMYYYKRSIKLWITNLEIILWNFQQIANSSPHWQ